MENRSDKKKRNYLRYPVTVKQLIEEVKILCDDYFQRRVTEKELRYYIKIWAECCGDKFIIEHEFNPTVKQRIGSKRMQLITKILQD